MPSLEQTALSGVCDSNPQDEEEGEDEEQGAKHSDSCQGFCKHCIIVFVF